MCNSPEAFLSLRSHFISSHALLCVSQWILGIGDRHLSNFMINMETGGMIGIDFGHAFGSATQVSYACFDIAIHRDKPLAWLKMYQTVENCFGHVVLRHECVQLYKCEEHLVEKDSHLLYI